MTDQSGFQLLRLQQSLKQELENYDPSPEILARERSRLPAALPFKPPPSTPVTQRFVITSDPQYPRLKDGGGDGTVADDDTGEALAKQRLRQQYEAIAAYRKKHGGNSAVPVLINGDLTEEGKIEWLDTAYDMMKDLLTTNYYPGLGNHDCEIFDHAFSETRCVQSMYHFVERCKNIGISLNMSESGNGDPFYQLYEGSFAYSKDIGDFCFIQLNNYPWYEKALKAVYLGRLETKEFKIHSSLSWLEATLIAAASRKKIAIISFHYWGKNDNASEQSKLIALCRRYSVALICNGHIHDLDCYMESGFLPCVRSGSSHNGKFLVAEYHKSSNQLCIYFANDNMIDQTKAVVLTALRPPAKPSGISFAWKSGLVLVSYATDSDYAKINSTFLVNGFSYRDTVIPPATVSHQIAIVDQYPGTTVELTAVNYYGQLSEPIKLPVPVYIPPDQPRIEQPRNLRFKARTSLASTELTWDPPAGGEHHAYVVTYGVKDHLPLRNFSAIEHWPPTCLTSTNATPFLLKITNPPDFYRGKYLSVRTTNHAGDYFSSPVNVPIDEILDAINRQSESISSSLASSAIPATSDAATNESAEALVNKRRRLVDQLLDVQDRLDKSEQKATS